MLKRSRRRPANSPLTRAQACPEGSRVARSQLGWLADVQEYPELVLWRQDRRDNLLAIAVILALHADWETMTTRPTWAVLEREAAALLGRKKDLSESVVARSLRWLRANGFLGIVEHGTTPQYSPGVLTLGPDGEARNSASVYLLAAPANLRLVAQAHPEDVGAEWVDAGPHDAVEAAAEQAEAGLAPPPLLASVPLLAPRSTPRPVPHDRSAQHPAHRPVDISDTPTPPVGRIDPHVRAREIRNLQDADLRRPDPAWERSKRPASKAERRAAALEARRLTPDLARLSTAYVAALCREWHLAGWTLADVLVALGRAPDGPAAAGYRHTNAVRHVPAWVRSRLAAWRADPLDPTSPPGASPSARASAARAHAAAVRRAVAERAAAAVTAHAVDGDQDVRAAVDVAGVAALRRAVRARRRDDDAGRP